MTYRLRVTLPGHVTRKRYSKKNFFLRNLPDLYRVSDTLGQENLPTDGTDFCASYARLRLYIRLLFIILSTKTVFKPKNVDLRFRQLLRINV